MDIRTPNPDRKRALLLIDMQQGFLTKENAWVVPNIQALVREGKYDLVAEATFSVDEDSLWHRQVGVTYPKEETVSAIGDLLPDDRIRIEKSSKSAFKGSIDLESALRAARIEEVHIAGIDTHDCVLATAYEAFDLGFFTYVIEECTASSVSEEYREKALAILREVEMTNRSELVRSHRTVLA